MTEATTTSALTWEIEDGIATITMDVPGESQNTLKAEFQTEFQAMIESLTQADDVQAAVFRSGKKDTFLAGADIGMIAEMTNAADAAAKSVLAQAAFDRLERLPFPVVAAIHGACLGGGLELALACRARVVSDHPKTRLGLPEVMLGLLPGAGGTQRLPRQIGVAAALDLMLTGRQVDGRKAKKLGLVDEVVPAANLLKAATRLARDLAAGRAEPARRKHDVKSALLETQPLGRAIVFREARRTLDRKTRGNYPAPYRIIDVVEAGQRDGFAAGLAEEARHFGELVVSPESAALRSIFFAQTELKRDPGVDDATVEPREVHHVGVLGGGLMGSGIAIVSIAKAGTSVRLKDRDDAGVHRAVAAVDGYFSKQARRGRYRAQEARALGLHLTGTTEMAGFERCEVVVEAVFEDLALKRRVLAEVEAATPETTIFATNTSSIPIARIAEGATRPHRVIGMHYFSPVEKMPLLEIIATPETSAETIATCVELGKRQGKTVIVVQDGPGFYTSRILAPYLNEAAWMISEGVPVDAIDDALEGYGFPVGPITLLDEVGIDVAAKVGPILIDAFGDRMVPPGTTDALVRSGRLGRKAGKGFYVYGDARRKKGRRKVDAAVYDELGITPSTSLAPIEIAERCTLQMVNEAVRCLEEGILRSPRDGDIGAIFGLGFPPFRGGPFRWVDSVGAAHVVARLEALAERFGARFEPAARLRAMAESGARFHDPTPPTAEEPA